MKITHYRPFGWKATACRIPPDKWPYLTCTANPHHVDCRPCLGVMHNAIGDSQLNADALREVTILTQDLATKKDIANLRAFIEEQFQALERANTTHSANQSRYLTIEQCAAYIGRTAKAVRSLVYRAEIPHIKQGNRLSFDRERIDRWMLKHARLHRVPD